MTQRTTYRGLGRYAQRLTRQQLHTLAGQIRADYCEDTMRGLAKLLDIRRTEEK